MIESKKNYRNSRLEFERHINLLIEAIESGQMIIPSEGTIRYLPNKRINLNTIEKRLSAMAMIPVMDRHIEYTKSQLNNNEEK